MVAQGRGGRNKRRKGKWKKEVSSSSSPQLWDMPSFLPFFLFLFFFYFVPFFYHFFSPFILSLPSFPWYPWLTFFSNLEKNAHDTVSMEVIWWSLEHKHIPYIYIFKGTYNGTVTSVRSKESDTSIFPITVSIYQDLALYFYIFVLVINQLTRQFRTVQ